MHPSPIPSAQNMQTPSWQVHISDLLVRSTFAAIPPCALHMLCKPPFHPFIPLCARSASGRLSNLADVPPLLLKSLVSNHQIQDLRIQLMTQYIHVIDVTRRSQTVGVSSQVGLSTTLSWKTVVEEPPPSMLTTEDKPRCCTSSAISHRSGPALMSSSPST